MDKYEKECGGAITTLVRYVDLRDGEGRFHEEKAKLPLRVKLQQLTPTLCVVIMSYKMCDRVCACYACGSPPLLEVVPGVQLFLDLQEEGGVPGIEPGYLVILLDVFRERVHVLVLDLGDQGLKREREKLC